jgi:aspartyl-tRNA(Asn)/glutamyl-tRNA(Gln) amidotransferase subunit C
MLTVEEVDRIARLGRLSLTDEEKTKYARQLSSILDYANQLAEIDVEGISPTATVLPVHSVMRDGDTVNGQIPREDALRNAPATDGESFIVQATLDTGDGN